MKTKLYDNGATISDGTQLTQNMIWFVSSDWGNYYDSVAFYYYTSYDCQTIKDTSSKDPLPTGVAEYTKVSNIYDLAGNVREATLEVYNTNIKPARSGDA